MYKFKEQFKGCKICIPKLKLEITKDNIDQYGAMLVKSYPQYSEMIESPKVAEVKETKPKSSPLKTDE